MEMRTQEIRILATEPVIAHDLDTVGAKLRAQLLVDIALRALLLPHDLVTRGDLFLRRASIDGLDRHASAQLLLEPANALHEELIEVGADDGQELEPLQQRVSRVLGLVQHTAVELQPGELTVQVQRGIVQINGFRSAGFHFSVGFCRQHVRVSLVC